MIYLCPLRPNLYNMKTYAVNYIHIWVHNTTHEESFYWYEMNCDMKFLT